MANNAKLPNLEPLIAAGINPKTGLPAKFGDAGCRLKGNIRKIMRIVDEQTAVNRYKWYNLPVGMSSQELERLLYYKGQLAFFYEEKLDKYYVLPYALSGGIDVYGRFNRIHPVPIAMTTEDENEKKRQKELTQYFSTINLDVLYDIVLPEELEERHMTECCVLLHDYTKQLSQTIIPRSEVHDPLLDVISNCIPYLNTALMNATGVSGVRVSNQDEAAQVEIASKALQSSALTGDKWIPMKGSLDFQDLSGTNVAKAEEFMLAMQSLDNFRLSLYGLENGGLFEKKAHILQDEQDMNMGTQSLLLKDGLDIRQRFCNIVNSVWGIGIWCETSEEVLNMDMDGDGIAAGDNDTESTGGGNDVEQ